MGNIAVLNVSSNYWWQPGGGGLILFTTVLCLFYGTFVFFFVLVFILSRWSPANVICIREAKVGISLFSFFSFFQLFAYQTPCQIHVFARNSRPFLRILISFFGSDCDFGIFSGEGVGGTLCDTIRRMFSLHHLHRFSFGCLLFRASVNFDIGRRSFTEKKIYSAVFLLEVFHKMWRELLVVELCRKTHGWAGYQLKMGAVVPSVGVVVSCVKSAILSPCLALRGPRDCAVTPPTPTLSHLTCACVGNAPSGRAHEWRHMSSRDIHLILSHTP